MLISVITVLFNDKANFEKTLKSIASQTFKNIEFIVIDGGSTDGTVDLIKRNEHLISYWISEPDKGLYDAMNKGLCRISGDFVNFLMAGDTIINPQSLQSVSKNLVGGDFCYFSRVRIHSEVGVWIYPPMAELDMDNWLVKNLPNFQSMFFPKSFYKRNRFDPRLLLTGDDDFKLLAIGSGLLRFVDEEFADFRRDGISSNHKSFGLFWQRVKESVIINLKHRRYLRLFLDPFKRLITFFVNSIFGDRVFLKFIRVIKKL